MQAPAFHAGAFPDFDDDRKSMNIKDIKPDAE
jgi:hypothetical protein